MRELVVLGTASQAPTRYRNHNGYLLLWDGAGILFDPGEGTQRQMALAGVSASTITHICITHFHGDHCLGLPGVLQRLSLDRVQHPIEVVYPESGQQYLDRLRHASVYDDQVTVSERPVRSSGSVLRGDGFELSAIRLDHQPETFGYRLVEDARRQMLASELARLSISGPLVGRLIEDGAIVVNGRTIGLEDVSVERKPQVVAFVMDTGLCEGAAQLAMGADLLICEATFGSADTEIAREYHHLTSVQAAALARDAGVQLVVLTHFSQRYKDNEELIAEARAVFPNLLGAVDLMRVPVPKRRQPSEA